MNKRDQAIKSAHAFLGNGPSSDLSPTLKEAIAKLELAAMRPGPYLYTDAIGSAEQRVEVVMDGEDLVARFPAVDGEDGADVLVRDMAGTFRKA